MRRSPAWLSAPLSTKWKPSSPGVPEIASIADSSMRSVPATKSTILSRAMPPRVDLLLGLGEGTRATAQQIVRALDLHQSESIERRLQKRHETHPPSLRTSDDAGQGRGG